MVSPCSNCSQLCSQCKHPDMPGHGRKTAKVMIVGEAPGADEDKLGEPFVGAAGRFLRKNLIYSNDYSDEDIFFTNAVRCRPPNNRIPKRAEILNCRPKLEEEIARIKPKVIIALGNTALCSIQYGEKVTGIRKWRGKISWSNEFNAWIVPAIHPASLMRDRGFGITHFFDQTISDFEKAFKLINKPAPEDRIIPKTNFLNIVEKAVAYLENINESEMIALDSETDGLDPRGDILCASFCYRNGNKYYPATLPWEMISKNKKISVLLKKLFLNTDIIKILHNESYDEKFFHMHDFDLRGIIYDTMNAASLLNENFSKGLKERAWKDTAFGGYEIPLEKYKYEHAFKKNTSYKEIPMPVLGPYAGTDAFVTYKLFEKYKPQLEAEKSWPLYHKVLTPARVIVTETEINGFYVDMKQAQTIEDRCDKAMATFKKNIYRYARKEFNIASTLQLSEVLFDELNAPNSGKTKADRWVCDKNSLKKIASSIEGKKKVPKKLQAAANIASAVLKYKYIDKLVGTYIGQAKRFVWEDGRIHPSFNMTGAVTGRMSNSKPCNHNIPKDRLIRSLYAATPGNYLIEADLKSAEMVVMAALSHDPVMQKIILSGQDIHNATFIEMFHKNKDYVPSQDERRIAKAINFGLIYGITPQGLARRNNLTLEEAEHYIEIYFDRFAGVKTWIEETTRFAHKKGYVLNPFYRRRRLTEINFYDDIVGVGHAERQAINAPVQGGASDYALLSIVRLKKFMRENKVKAKIVHTVHDSVLIDTPPSEVKLIQKLLKQAFETRIKAIPMPMRIDIEVSRKWGEHGESNLETILKECSA